MEEVIELKKQAEVLRSSSIKLAEEAERLMTEHRSLVKKARTFNAKASNSAKMRDECAREAANSDQKADIWKNQHDDRKYRNALNLDNERNQMHMHTQSAKGMRVREKRAESESIKFKKMADECNEKASISKKKSALMWRESHSDYDLYVGVMNRISKLERK
ncbi:MAG TPA: hypothetical protein VJY42_02360 [Candidatus Methanomethylophilaceae archaeon]|nr:hypothetical protein [Candidatus Methanomethylophilaceae archaeon]